METAALEWSKVIDVCKLADAPVFSKLFQS